VIHRALLPIALLFTACLGEGQDKDALEYVRSAQSGLRVSMGFIARAASSEHVPASIAGMATGAKMGRGGEAENAIPSPIPTGTKNVEVKADTELLAAFIKLLQIDVQSYLNSARNREDALKEYRNSLESHAQRGRLRQRALSDRQKDLEDDERRLKRLVRDLQRELEKAIGEGKSGDASLVTQELVEKQSSLAKAETELIVTERLHESYGDILKPLQERLDAINANRPALIQGVRVVDIPGVEDIGVIEYDGGIPRFRRRGRGIF
jgi:hypothetical protein